ncbi:MAG: PHB depolymerase family esterase, partial [Rhizomicrobium sp.]
MRRLCSTGLAAIAWMAAGPASAFAQDPLPGLHENVVFSDYPALARNSELLSRVFTPLTLAGVKRDLARTGKTLGETSVDLTAEKFLIYVPATRPPGGYRLMVFVPPWQKAQLPQGWGPVLDRFGMIFVTPARSGNDEDIVSRREPLALIAAQNAMVQYSIDPAQVFVGGMSGGSRMALRLALAYPDLFHGAFLNSGSDVIGTIYEPLPAAPLFRQFQSGTRLVYVTGDQDAANVESETRSRRSMLDWCVLDVASIKMPFTGHEVASPAILGRALEALLQTERPNADRMASCRTTIEANIAAELGKADALLAGDKRADAQKLIKEI